MPKVTLQRSSLSRIAVIGRIAAVVLFVGAGTPLPAADSASTSGGAWPLPGGDAANRHFSPLRAIDSSNVAHLKPAWTFHSQMRGGFEATPIVVDGIMYVSTAGDDVVALDAASGAIRGY